MSKQYHCIIWVGNYQLCERVQVWLMDRGYEFGNNPTAIRGGRKAILLKPELKMDTFMQSCTKEYLINKTDRLIDLSTDKIVPKNTE